MAFLCASLSPYAVNDNGPGLAELERVFREQVYGCSSLQRPLGPAAIISHSFCPFSLAGCRSIHRWQSFQALSKGHNKRLHHQASLSLNIQYTHKCTQQTHSYAIRFSFSLFFFFFWCGRIYFLITLFKSILVLSPSEGECLRKGGVPIVRETELMFSGDWIDALSLEDQCKPCKIHIYLRFLLRSTTWWEEIKLGDNLSLQTCVSYIILL